MDFDCRVWRSFGGTWDTRNQGVALSSGQRRHFMEAWVYSPGISPGIRKDIEHKMSSRLCSRSVQMGDVGKMRKQQVTPRTFLPYPTWILYLHHSHISYKCLFLQWTRHGKYYIAVGKCSTMPGVPYLSITICSLSNSRPIKNEQERRYLLFAVRNTVSVRLWD